ncbi:hypothetical protein A4A49_10463 [Nicotiana attenuata]|uniref:Uncharacterized protein n=1 Tax=Nicotiana attenuata TaxID=49451 RepID=A0A314L4H3_NICAT|nr:hypothetical protein A4A49_10463 [Nicotiana attenuata]
MDKLNVESITKATMEKLKEIKPENMVENAKEIVKKSTPILANFVKTSFDWLLERIPQHPMISTTKEKMSNWMKKSPLSFTNISIGSVLILLFYWCCKGKGKTMKAPGKKNARISRSSFESNPKSYFRDLRSKKSS